jgi:hypothetical protein
MFITALAVTMSAGAAKENVIRIQNNLRFGYDDNVYLNNDEVDSVEIIEVLNISGKAEFSSRSDAVFSYQPEVRYRPDVDPEFATYHDAYLKLNHAFSQRVFLTVSDRLRYQQRDSQSGVVSTTDQNYLENDLMGSLSFTVNQVSSLTLGGGYEFRTWDDDNYGEVRGNNYDKYDTSLSYFRELGKDTTKGMLGVDYTLLDYDGTRGGADSVTLMTGADTIFNPNLNGFGRIGASMSSIDTAAGSEDQTTPYLDAGIEYNPSERTSLNGNIGYSIYQSDNSLYNAQDRASLGLGFRHDITAKINVAGTVSYIMSQYDGTLRTALGPIGIDADDDWLQFNIRGTYQINRNNFAEIGYSFTDRSVSSSAGGLSEYSRNRFDIGWRLRL